jgi:hydrogenase maturation protease
MGDDGLGLVALEILRDSWNFQPDVELLDGGTWGMNLLPLIESAERVLLLDAIKAGAAPGTVVVLERDDLPRFFSTKLSPHQIDMREVLALAELRETLPDYIVAIGLQPEVVEMSTELSPVLRNNLDSLVDRVIQQLRDWGHEARRNDAK